jgi:hypothetical protein
LIKLRKSHPALDADGEFRVIYAESGQLPFVYSRVKGEQKILVAINPSNREVQVDLPGSTINGSPKPIDAPRGAILNENISGWHLSLPPVSGAIYEM